MINNINFFKNAVSSDIYIGSGACDGNSIRPPAHEPALSIPKLMR